MSWMELEAKCEACFNAVERAVPILKSAYRNVDTRDVLNRVGRERVWELISMSNKGPDALTNEIISIYEKSLSAGTK
jgi:hypothetical protein